MSTLPQFENQVRNVHPHTISYPSSAVQRLALRIMFVLFVALLCRTQLFAAVHPVPLEPKTDAAKCIECHEEKTKGKAVHSAIAMGCLSCHEIRSNKDITRVKLITTTPQSLCITCHADKDAATLKGTIHPPAVRDCIKCHDPHQSDNKNQLLKSTSRRKRPESLSRLPYPGIECPRKRQPPRRPRYGLRNLPRHPQSRREGQSMSSTITSPRPCPRSASIATMSRMPPSSRRIRASLSARPTACSATIRTSRRSPS